MGHLFVVHGDLHRLDCDGWLLPTDASLHVEPWSAPAFDDHGCSVPTAPPAGWHRRVRTLRVDRTDAPPVWLTDVGADRPMPLTWYLDGVRAFVEDASGSLAEDPTAHGPAGRRSTRHRPLLGLPIIATGEGGMKEHPDRVLLDLVPELQRLAADADVDLALVTPDRLAYDAAQAARRRRGDLTDVFGDRLPAASLDAAARLAARIRDRQVGLFVGAGISMGAGLPSWRDLLVEIAGRVGDRDLARELSSVLAERRLDPLDVASLLASRLDGDRALREAVSRITEAVPRHALAHGLIAALDVDRTVTTNYDRLLEQAVAGARRDLAVLPYSRPRPDQPWLLKLHGDVSHRDDIVLTRQDFLRYAADRNALTGVVHALLLTQHLLFVGYSLSDPNFHRIIDEVRRALGRAGETSPEIVGTVLVAEPPSNPVRELWGRDLAVVVPTDRHGPAAFRDHDLWLDALAMAASDPDAHLLSPRFAGLLDERQRAVRDAVRPLATALDDGSLQGTAADRVAAVLHSLGHRPAGG